MATQDLVIYGDRIDRVEKHNQSYGGAELEIEINNVDLDSVLSDIGMEEAISYFGEDDLLDKIGKEAAIKYFEIKESEE